MKYFTDLHNHLYGSIPAKLLYEIGKKNPNPRWFLYTDLYKKLYNKEFDTNNFFEKYSNLQDFSNLYHFKKQAPFLEFQCKFNLIIALSKFDVEEIEWVSEEIFYSQYSTGVRLAEYRLMYSPLASYDDYISKTISACRGLEKAEKKIGEETSCKLVLSLHRDSNFQEQYSYLKELQSKNELVQKYLVGIDFCYIEENHPPKYKKDFFEKVLLDNQKNPESALSILYHVGESYTDKTPISAARWVYESALFGAHRLGHCIALGVDPLKYKDQIIEEKISERIDTLNFFLDRIDEFNSSKIYFEKKDLQNQIDQLKNHQSESIKIKMDSLNIEILNLTQNLFMEKIAKLDTIIEVCPSSNLYIGMLENLNSHPIKRFIEKNLKLTISTDDAGIFDTDIQKEYNLLEDSGVDKNVLEEIRKKSFQYRSEIIAGKYT
jgi:adenosine deaminase